VLLHQVLSNGLSVHALRKRVNLGSLIRLFSLCGYSPNQCRYIRQIRMLLVPLMKVLLGTTYFASKQHIIRAITRAYIQCGKHQFI
jgi:hypothetical protein